MIPTIENILKALFAGDMDVATASRYIATHIELAERRGAAATAEAGDVAKRVAMIDHPMVLTWGEELAKAIEDNHIISGGNGPNFSAGWSAANSCAADITRLRVEKLAQLATPTVAASSAAEPSGEARIRLATLEEAARACEKLAEQRFDDHGTREPDTGACYYGGRVEEEYQARDEEDADCAAAIRALAAKHDTAPQALKAGDAPETVSEDARMLDMLESVVASNQWIVSRNTDSFTVSLDPRHRGAVTRKTLREAIRAAMSAAGDADALVKGEPDPYAAAGEA